MPIEPVPGEPAALVGDALVISDLHVGLEVELRRSGVEVPSRSDEKERRLHELLDRTGADRALLNGDLKHNVPHTSRQEADELADILRRLSDRVPVTVLPGNHDGGIEEIAPDDVEAADPRGTVVDGVGVLHGHSLPSDPVLETDALLLGHTHPKVTLREPNGARVERRAWLRFPGDTDVVVMPAFEDWGGSDVLRENLLGPIDYGDDPDVTLLDGTRLGTLESLRENQPEGPR